MYRDAKLFIYYGASESPNKQHNKPHHGPSQHISERPIHQGKAGGGLGPQWPNSKGTPREHARAHLRGATTREGGGGGGGVGQPVIGVGPILDWRSAEAASKIELRTSNFELRTSNFALRTSKTLKSPPLRTSNFELRRI